MPTKYVVASWNLENLLDIENSPRRTEKLQRALGKELKGWTEALLAQKVARLAAVINRLNSGNGPDILGVCEVENDYVIGLLRDAMAQSGRNYAIQHHDSPDQRGIDVGLIYDADLFSVEAVFDHFVMRRTATRDILQVNFMSKPKNHRLVLMMNHWPSRSAGKLESAAYRAIAGETLAYFHQRAIEVCGADTPVMAMGDFNDEPLDTSIIDYALAVRSRANVMNAKDALFLDLMWGLAAQGLGTYHYQNWPNLLDQFLVNRGLLNDKADIRVIEGSVDIVRDPAMTTTGKYPQPKPFGGMGKPVDTDGASDHFPIKVELEEA